jgi:hypothetical protein
LTFATVPPCPPMAHGLLLRSHGCDEIQGYFFSKPLPYPQLTQILAQLIGPQPRPGAHPREVVFWP